MITNFYPPIYASSSPTTCASLVVRMPKSLHRELVEVANKEGASLNAFISTALGKAVGQPSSEP